MFAGIIGWSLVQKIHKNINNLISYHLCTKTSCTWAKMRMHKKCHRTTIKVLCNNRHTWYLSLKEKKVMSSYF